MNTLASSGTGFSDSKQHYQILDGLRGVAALIVVTFHIFEAFSLGDPHHQLINHGYLAVDFFFVLSGFVIGYAYDDRWGKMTTGDFFKRRLVRLHPMIIVGMVVGAIGFYFGASPTLFPKISTVPVWELLLVMVIGFTLIPVPSGIDIRGWGEMHPLDGPGWSLFFEYVGNILYGLVVRRFSNKLLLVLVLLSGAALIHLTITKGDVVGGWSIEPTQLWIGFTRLMYPFFGGLLLSRVVKPGQIKNAFVWCSFLIIVVLAVPRLGGTEHLWVNGIYESVVILFVFPLIVYIGASGSLASTGMQKVSNFLGDISYPIYITHYPLIYIYTAWVFDNKVPLADGWIYGVIVLVSAVVIAYGSLKLYDIPVRRWLTAKFIRSASVKA